MGLTTINPNNIYQKDVIGNVRQAQEDSHDIAVMTPNGDVFVVCDGMGGHVGGKMASSIAVRSIIEHLKKEKYASPYEAMDGALQYANMQILGYANEHPELKGMGTTACILILQDDYAYIAHVGDSRIYLYLGKEKQLHRITKDHSFVQTLVDAGQIKDEEAEHHPNKNRILKALGIKPELQPTFNYQNKPILPKNGDIFLICSDGLSGMISEKTIANVLGSKLTIEQKGDLLIDKALKGEDGYPGGQDNITVELIKIDSSKHQKSEFKSYNPAPSKSKRKKGMSAGLWALIGVAVVAIIAALAFIYIKMPDNVEKWQSEYNDAKAKIEANNEKMQKLVEQNQSLEKLGLDENKNTISNNNKNIANLQQENNELASDTTELGIKIRNADSTKKINIETPKLFNQSEDKTEDPNKEINNNIGKGV